MDNDMVYSVLRTEILDQRKCQFQMYTMAASITSASLVFAESSGLGFLAFLAPMIFNNASLMMVVIKELSVFRKVAYLQLLEQYPDARKWKWETDLDSFRNDTGYDPGAKRSHNHTYPLMLCLFINLLNAVSAALYFFNSSSEVVTDRMHGFADGLCVFLIASGLYFTITNFWSLILGKNTTSAIVAKWRRILKLPVGTTA